MNDVTLLVSSCDKYKDAWHPFFEMLRIYGGEFSFPIVLNTETGTYKSEHFDVRVVNTPWKATWSERMRNVLSQIETEFVLLTLEDYFLKAPFDHKRFEKVMEYIRCHEDVGVVDISPRWVSCQQDVADNLKTNDFEDSFFVRNRESFNITVVPTVWRRDFLMDLLRDHEDVWSFEIYSGIRAKNTGKKVVRFSTPTPTIYEYDYQVWTGMGITRGQWLPRNVDFFKTHGVEVNFDNLGILNVRSVEEIKQLHKKDLRSILSGIRRRIRNILTKRKSLK